MGGNKTITIDGVEYVPRREQFNNTDHVCVVVDQGWIFEGYKENLDTPTLYLREAHVVRSWSNGRGIGALADAEHKDDYTLDNIGDLEINPSRVIATIPLRW